MKAHLHFNYIKMRITTSVFFLVFTSLVQAQSVQTIRGIVIDYASNIPIRSATVQVTNLNPAPKVITDSTGYFTFSLPVGRYNLEASSTGYFPAAFRDILIGAAKETFVTLTLQQRVGLLREVVLQPRINKEQPLNSMATVSGKLLSVEEARRFAGGFDDPARLASSFAGVAGNIDQNGIIVRGNAPKFLQWKMEGVEIPNPNHFGDLETIGSGILTAMSSQVLGNSDFFSGAFPAEYSNALSGVFDISMRRGNSKKHEHTFQIGVLGIDASSEGPFKKNRSSSYLFNYRYSTLALVAPVLPENGNSIKYQDLSFKLNFPTRKAGTITIWGIGLSDGAGSKPRTDRSEWVYNEDNEKVSIEQYMGVLGLSHKYFLNRKMYIKSVLAMTGDKIDWDAKKLDDALVLKPLYRGIFKEQNLILSSYINTKFNERHTNKTGLTMTGMFYDMKLNKAFVSGSTPAEILNENGSSTMLSAFTSSSIGITDHLTMNAGLNCQYFVLNRHSTIEPRIGFRLSLGAAQAISLAYGLHSRIEKLNYYFNNDIYSGEKAVNKNLDFTKAHHFVLGYDWSISELYHLKIEPYFQQLYSVPVIPDSSFSFLNLQGDWFFASKLQNTGKGRNMGIELTFEKYISKGYYFLATGSVFKSEYKGGDNVWRNTRFNRNYVGNILGGKEWKTGDKKQNILSVNTRFTFQGGSHYSPVNQPASAAKKDVVYDELKAFSLQASPSFNVHLTVSYKINKRKSAQEIAFKLLNVTNQPDFKGHQFNLQKNTVEIRNANIAIPNISYKIEF